MMLRLVRGDPKLGPVSWEVRRPLYRVVAICRVVNAAGFLWPEGLESGFAPTPRMAIGEPVTPCHRKPVVK
jgi:hypothetical protein